ncbi:LLM class flavin-dependent oxidoreductase [Nocardioides sp. Bht2]|uniref:LLM class flavin-dependent oxidoreductase n=1 Tax=Nocardioides sp. Bht2 TaxID=3392297 RepID=UPI0039B54294
MRHGLLVPASYTDWPTLRSCWEVADADPIIESAWLTDHLFASTELGRLDSSGDTLESWTTAAALAMVTERIRIGFLMANVSLRAPFVIAKMAANLDHLSGGRLELGIGAGWAEAEAQACGTTLGTPKERLARQEEALEIITQLLTGEPVSFDGEHFKIELAQCVPAPVQTPRPPIAVGGHGLVKTPRLAAQWADHWNCNWRTPEEWTERRDAFVKACEVHGRDLSTMTTSTALAFDPAAPEKYLELLAEYERRGADLVIAVLDSGTGPDDVQLLIDTIRNR